MTIRLRCPVRGCDSALAREATRVICPAGHSFDVARSGYIGLLQPQDRKSKMPGDTTAAVGARRRLVVHGIEANIVAELAAFTAKVATARHGNLLDAGCGEGSVTMALSVATGLAPVGVDISSSAVDRAARRYPTGTWIVANADRDLPFVDGCVSVVASVVARRNPGEFHRVLEPEGVCIVVVPGEDDLTELREAVLGSTVGRDRTATVEGEFAEGFELIGRRSVRDRVWLDRGAIEDVLASTYRGARVAERQRAESLTALDVTLSREALAFRRVG